MGPISGGPIDLAHARLRQAFLQYATLTGANLEGADLAETDLRGSRLEGASLFGADLRDAVLDRANLADANLTGANLRGASLVGARNLTTAQLQEAEGDGTTVLPDYLEAPLIWNVGQSVGTPASASTVELRPAEEPRGAVEPQEVNEQFAETAPEPVVVTEIPIEPEAPMETQVLEAVEAVNEAQAPREPVAQKSKPPEAPAQPGERTSWLVGGPKREARPRPDRSYGKPGNF
jgi:uncharacterized protein YjbI with pentapeptide repeats